MKALFKFIVLICLICWLLIIFLLGAALSFKNAQLIDVDLIIFSVNQQPLGLILALAMLMGLLLAVMLLAPMILTLKFRLRQAQKRSNNDSIGHETQNTSLAHYPKGLAARG